MCLYVVRHNSQVVFETKMSLTEAIDTLRLIRSEKKRRTPISFIDQHLFLSQIQLIPSYFLWIYLIRLFIN